MLRQAHVQLISDFERRRRMMTAHAMVDSDFAAREMPEFYPNRIVSVRRQRRKFYERSYLVGQKLLWCAIPRLVEGFSREILSGLRSGRLQLRWNINRLPINSPSPVEIIQALTSFSVQRESNAVRSEGLPSSQRRSNGYQRVGRSHCTSLQQA